MSENKVTSKRAIGLFYGAWIGALLVAAAVVAGLVHASNLALGRQTAALAQQANQGDVVLAQRALRPAAFERVTYPGEIHGFFESPIYAKVPGYVKSMSVDKAIQRQNRRGRRDYRSPRPISRSTTPARITGCKWSRTGVTRPCTGIRSSRRRMPILNTP